MALAQRTELVLFVVLATIICGVHGVTRNVVCCNVAHIQGNISQASANDVIQLGAGVFNKNCPVTSLPNFGLTIQGTPGSTYLGCGATAPVFRVPNAGTAAVHTLKDMTFSSANVSPFNYTGSGQLQLINVLFTANNGLDGSVATVTTLGSGTVTLTNCLFSASGIVSTNPSTYSLGGALRFIGGTISVTNTNFVLNSAYAGGAVHVVGPARLTMNNCLFDKNTATAGNGGAVMTGGTVNMTVTGSTFTNNIAFNNGAAISNFMSLDVVNVVITSSTFAQNGGVSLIQAGNVYFGGSSVISANVVSRTLIAENCNYALCAIQVVDTTISGNRACVLLNFEYDLLSTVKNVQFTNNIIGSVGPSCDAKGGLRVWSFPYDLSLSSLTFRNNIINDTFEDGYGTLLLLESASSAQVAINLTNIVLESNSVTGESSPGLTVYGAGTLVLSHSVLRDFTGKSALDICGPYLYTPSHFNVTMFNVTMKNIVSPNEALYVFKANVYIDASSFSGLMATGCSPIYIAPIFVNISNSVFSANGATGSEETTTSGALEISDGVAHLQNLIFSANSGVHGGALLLDNGYGITSEEPHTVTNCSFFDNTADSVGGAIYVSFNFGQSSCLKSIYFTNITVNRNRVTNPSEGGGGMYISRLVGTGAVYIVNSYFSLNSAKYGGAIGGPTSNVGHVMFIYGTTFKQNTAVSGGGAVALAGVPAPFAKMTVGNCSFIRNSATGNPAPGGAIFIRDDTAKIFTTGVNAFIGNIATSGGAIQGGTEVCVSDSLFEANSATSVGGAISANSATAMCSNFTSNIATLAGGAIYASDLAHIFGLNRFERNAADQGGAIFTSLLISMFNTYNNNSARQLGGAIYSCGDNLFVSYDLLTSNTAQQGGAIFVSNNPSALLTRSFVNNNVAQEGGGIYCDLCTMTISADSQIAMNTVTAGSGPGFFCTSGHLDPVAPGVFFNNSAPATVTQSGTVSYSEADVRNCGGCAPPSNIFYPTRDCLLYDGSPCNYVCEAGYTQNFNNYTCHAGVQAPELCHPIACTPFLPENFSDVTLLPSSPNPHTNDFVVFSCNFGFSVSPIFNITRTQCLGPDWIPTPNIKCIAQNCTFNAQPPNGRLSKLVGGAGEVTELTCDPGYSITNGKNTSVCFGTLSCSDGWCPLGSCTPTQCDVIPAFPGRKVGPVQAQTGQNVTVSCNPGFAPTVPYFVTCMPDGKYHPAIQNCTAIPCPPIFAPGNGSVNNPNPDTANFACNLGYYLVGPAVVTCSLQQDGTRGWGVSPTCAPITCTFGRGDVLEANCTMVFAQEACSVGCKVGTAGPAVIAKCVGNEQFVPSISSLACDSCQPTGFATKYATQCTTCPNGYTKKQFPSELADCWCFPNFYESSQGNGNCTACPYGGHCAGEKTQPVNAPGFFTSDNPLVFYACDPPEACLFNKSCAEGYGQYLCGVCEPGYYKLNGYCTICPHDSGLRITLFLVLSLLACTLLVLIAEPSPIAERSYGVASVSIAVNFFQIVATFLNTNLNWGSSTHSFFGGLSSFNLNLELASPECVFPLTFYDKMQAVLIAPFVVAGLMVVVCGLLMLKAWIQAKRPSWVVFKVTAYNTVKSSIAGFFLFMTLAYLTLVKSGFEMFACNKQVGATADDTFYIIASSPGDRCYSDVWNRNAVLAIFAIIVYVAGTPGMVIAAYLRQRKLYGSGMAGEDILSNFFVNKYNKNAWFWETIVMLRKFLVVMIALFLGQSPFIQAICCVFVFFAATVLNLLRAPYKWFYHNLVEDGSMLACLVVLFSGIATTSSLLTKAQAVLADVVAVVAVCVAIAVLVVVLFMELYVFIKVALLLKKHAPVSHSAVNVHGISGRAIRSLVPDPSVVCGVLSAGADGRVMSLNMDGKGIAIDQNRSFDAPGVTCLVNVPDSMCVLVCAGNNVQVVDLSYQSSLTPTTLATLDHPITCALMDEKRILCVGAASGHVRLYQFHRGQLASGASPAATRRVDVAESDITTPTESKFRSRLSTYNAFDAFAHTGDELGSFNNNNGGSKRNSFRTPSPEPSSEGRRDAPAQSIKLSLRPPEGATLLAPPGAAVGAPALLPTPGGGDDDFGPVISLEVPSVVPARAAPDSLQARLELGHAYEETHAGAVVALATGTRFFYSSDEHLVRRWSPKRPRALREWVVTTGDEARITALEVMGSHIFCASSSSVIFDLDTQNNVVRMLSGHTSRVTCLFAKSGHLFSGADDGQVRIWDPEERSKLQRLPNSNAAVTALCVSGARITWGLANGTIRHSILDRELDYLKPETILEPIYRRVPCLRPCGGQRANKKVIEVPEDEVGNTDHVSLLMEEFSLEQMPESQAGRVFVALEESMARYDDKARRGDRL